MLHGAVGPSVRFVHDALKHNNNNNNNIIIIIIYLKTETAHWTYIFLCMYTFCCNLHIHLLKCKVTLANCYIFVVVFSIETKK